MRYDNRIIDAHVHIMNSPLGIEAILKLKEELGYSAVNVLSIEAMGDLTQNPVCMLFKALSPDDYAFGSLWYTPAEDCDHMEQAFRLSDIGFDGIKMIEGKPDVRKAINKPLDDPSYDSFYRYMERNGIPLLLHAADPESFWDEGLVPAWARENGWYYGDGTFASKEKIYSEVEGVLSKFKELKLILAHFFFLSASLERASDFLDAHPNVCLDVTAGTEMYVNFSARAPDWRDFFIKYQDRIIFGTDNSDTTNETDTFNLRTINSLENAFLQEDKQYKAWNLVLTGIDLPFEVLEKIYCKNFLRLIPRKPNKINLKAAIEFCARRLNKCREYSLSAGQEQALSYVLGRLNELYAQG